MKPKVLIDASERAILASFGIVGDSARFYTQDAWLGNIGIATDAQPQLITAPSVGIPAFLSNLLDPEVIRILTSPMKAVEIFGEQKKGDWTTLTTQFPVVEPTGEVSSYGDWNNNGSSGANVSFVPRQSYHYQTISQWGERQLDIWGLAKLSYVAEVNAAAALVLSKFQNKSYFFGIAGLPNYGFLNDPNLIASITPTTKAAGGTTWAAGIAKEIYSDVLKLFTQLQIQMGGRIDMNETMTLALSPTLMVSLSKVSDYNITALQTIKTNFPNLRIVSAPEYSTQAGEFMQLFIDSVEGVRTAYGAFTEKMRMHPVIVGLSNFMQKKSAGTWGAIIRRPIAIASMLGM